MPKNLRSRSFTTSRRKERQHDQNVLYDPGRHLAGGITLAFVFLKWRAGRMSDKDTIYRQEVIDVLKEYTVSGWVVAQFDILKEEIELLQEPKTAASGSISRTSAEKTHDKTTGDCISRQAAIDAVADGLKRVFVENRDVAEILLKNVPSAQPEIIRCKDCRNNHWCNIQEAAMAGDNFFCGAAERRTDETD